LPLDASCGLRARDGESALQWPARTRGNAEAGAEGDGATIELIEPLGQQTNVYLATEAGRLISVVDRIHSNVGDKVQLRAVPDQVRLIVG
jgi:hypothetical protein